MKMKKIAIFSLLLLCATGCGQMDKKSDGLSSYEKEEIKCVEGNKIWIYKIGRSNSSSVTSQIIGRCM